MSGDVQQLRIVTPATDAPLELAFVRDQHLRVASGTAEDAYIDRLILTSWKAAVRATRRSLSPETLELSLDHFPCHGIELPRPPIIAIDSIEYIDGDGVEQTLDPATYILARTGRDENLIGLVLPAYNTYWPCTRCQPGAVTITYEAGYTDGGSPATVTIPDDITHGMLLMIGELYKQRSESVHAFNQNPALIRARDLWQGYRVY